MKTLILASLLLGLYILSAQATPFSLFNRYELSYEAVGLIRSSVRQNDQNTWYSINKLVYEAESLFFKKNLDGQTVGADFNMLGGLEYAKKSNRFGVISGTVKYLSEHIRASATGDVYSVEKRAASLAGDHAFERFVKEGAHEPIVGMFDFRGNVPEGYIEASYKSLTLLTGKQKMRWGPGYKGTLGLSGSAYSPFYFYNLGFEFGNILNAQVFLCGYEDESTYRSELDMSESIIIKESNRSLKTFFPRYGAGQRVDFKVGKHVQIGVYELVDFFGSNEFTRFANPLQMYYLANESSGTNNANMLAGIDFNVVFSPFRFYGEFINDDITVFEKTGNPDKFALQLGAAYYGKDQLTAAGIEYTHLTRYIYGHSRILTRHANWGESMGWPFGNYMDVLTAYSVFSLPKNFRGRVEANYWRKGDGSIEDEWYADGKPDLDEVPFFPENPSEIFSIAFSAEYSPLSWLTYSFCYEPVIQNRSISNEVYTYLRCSLPNFKRGRN